MNDVGKDPVPQNARRSNVTRLVLFGCLAASILLFAIRGPKRAIDGRKDLTGPYTSSKAWFEGSNPYDLQTNLEIVARESIGDPETYTTLTTYPPSALVVLAPVAALHWKTAQVVWLIVSVLLFLVASQCVSSLAEPKLSGNRALIFWILAIAWAPFHTGLALGQLAIVSASLVLISVYLSDKGRPGAAGVCAALALSLKPQLGGFLLVYFFIQRQWRALFATVAVWISCLSLGILRIEWLGYHNWFHDMIAAIRSMPGLNVNSDNPARYGRLNIEVLVRWFVENPDLVRLTVIGIIGPPTLWWMWMLWKKQRSVNPLLAISPLFALGLLAVYHRPYDATLLISVVGYCLATAGRGANRVVNFVFAASLVFIVPGSALLQVMAGRDMFPSALTNSSIWHLVVMPHQTWALCIITTGMLYLLHGAVQCETTAAPRNSGPTAI